MNSFQVNGAFSLSASNGASSPAPPPPPPPHFNTSSVTTPSGGVIPPAPRMPLPPIPSAASSSSSLPTVTKKLLNASKFVSAANPRDELMSAIRGAGGVNGLRKASVPTEFHLYFIFSPLT